MNPQTISIIHTLLKIVGSALAAHGATKSAAFVNSEDCVGLIMALVGVWLSYRSNQPAAIIQKAADALPAGTVIPATTEAAPKAQVLTPESATDFIRKPTPVDPAQK